MQNTLIERLFWHTAERDDSKVAHHLFYRKEMDTVYTLDEATLFDFFFHDLREIDVFPLLEDLDPQTQQRETIPFLQFVLIYLMSVIGSIPKMEPVWELLLTDELLMGLCGFNAYQVKGGSYERGTKLRKRPVPEVRGALCVDTLANQIVKITPLIPYVGSAEGLETEPAPEKMIEWAREIFHDRGPLITPGGPEGLARTATGFVLAPYPGL